MNTSSKPIYLFADSQLLFWKELGRPFLEQVRNQLESESPKAAYIGASNDDEVSFYNLFEAAMDTVAITDRQMVTASFTPAEADFIATADLILLAGGEVERGWRRFQENGLDEIIPRRVQEGALLVGISAGAIQLGLLGWSNAFPRPETPIETFGLVPLIIGVHEEANDWQSLKESVLTKKDARGIGIPAGAGLAYHADGSLEPLRYPLSEFSVVEGALSQSLLFPGFLVSGPTLSRKEMN